MLLQQHTWRVKSDGSAPGQQAAHWEKHTSIKKFTYLVTRGMHNGVDTRKPQDRLCGVEGLPGVLGALTVLSADQPRGR